MVGASMRASSAFVVSLVLGLVGIGLGPTVVGLLSDAYAKSAFVGNYITSCPGGRPPPGAAEALVQACGNASAVGIRHALMTMSLLFVWAGVHYFLASRTLQRDLEIHYDPLAATVGTTVQA
jgi:hypothetical protein